MYYAVYSDIHTVHITTHILYTHLLYVYVNMQSIGIYSAEYCVLHSRVYYCAPIISHDIII